MEENREKVLEFLRGEIDGLMDMIRDEEYGKGDLDLLRCLYVSYMFIKDCGE